MKNFKSNLKKAVLAIPLVLAMLLFGTTAVAGPGWSNTSMSARQSNADELSDRQPSSAWQPSYQGYQSQLFEIGTTNVPSDYSEISSESSSPHKAGPRKLGGGTDPGEQSENSPIGEPWIMFLFALLACGVIAYRRMNIKHHNIMKRIITSSFHEKLKMLLVLIGVLIMSVSQMWAGAGWWDDGGVVLTFSVNGTETTRTLNKTSQGGTTSLGTVTTAITLKGAKGNVWKSGGNICSVSMYYRVKNSGGTVVYDKSGSATALPYSSTSGSNQVWQKTNINDDLLNGGLAPGTYTFECWFTATGDENSTSGCGTTFWYSNSSNNYKYTFIVPSKNLTVAGAANGNTVSGSVTGITKGTAYTITATPTTGYTFGGWSATSGGSSISIADASSATTTVTFSNYSNNATVTATFNAEASHSVTITYKCGTTTVSTQTSQNIGEVTAASITAPTVAGYTFSSWTLGNGISNQSANTSANPISVKTKASGTYTMQANYTEDLTTTWYIAGATGTNYPFTGWGTSGIRMTKKTGHSTEEIYYCDVVVNRVATGNEYEFQTYNSANSTYYGYNNKDITKESNSTTVYSGNPNNMHFKPYLTGTYEFKLDNTGANPVLTVTWPVYNQVRISAASPTADATNVGNFDLGAAVSNVRSVTRSLKANDTYTFKVVSNSEWYGYNSGAFTRSTSTSSNSLTTSTSGGDMTLTTDYAGDYTFKFNESTKALSVDFPEAYQVTYGKGSVNGSTGTCSAIDLDNGSASVTSNSTWVLSGHKVKLTAPNAKTGYTWKGWYGNNSGTGDAISVNQVCTLTVNSNKTAYACYTENNYTVTVNAGAGGTVASGSVIGHKDTKVTLPTATANTGYYFTGWTVTTGTATLTSASSATAAKVSGLTAVATVTANFAPIWYLKGDFNSWGETHPLTLASSTSGSVTLTTASAKLSNQKFKIWNKQTDKYYQKANQSITRAANTANSGWTEGGTSNDMKFTSDVIGNYTFAVTFTSNIPSALTVTYPTAYKINYGVGTHNGSSTAISVSPSFSSGDYVLPETDVTFSKGTTKTGYTWKGWYSTTAGGGTTWSTSNANLSLTATRTGDISVYACYNLVNYTITYNLNGGTNPVSPAPPTSYTIESSAITLPTPTKEGYVFAGWYSDAELTTPVSSIPAGSTGNKSFWAKWDQKGTYTIYYYNKDSWANTYAYIWDGGSGTYESAWPGEQMFIHQGKVYKHDYVLSTVSYDKVIFNNGLSGGDEEKTDDLNIADGLGGNQWFYNPNDASVNTGSIHHGWSQYIMVADFPTTKQVAVVGEKITIEPVISWADVIEFDDITITATKTSGSPNITVMAAGTKIIATATAAGEATYTVTYTYSTTTITKTLEVQFTQGVVIQSKVPKTDEYWKNSQDVEGIHYWGTNLTSGDVKMTWLKADENYDYYQALVPLGTDNKTNFLFYYDNYTTDAWRKTLDVTNVTEDGCYIIGLTNSNKDVIRTATKDGTGLCNDSYQLVITMGSGDIYTSNIVTSNSEIVSFFAPSNANESKTYRQGTVTLEHNGLTVHTYPANTFSASGVYTAKINADYSLNSLALYTGDYYIRTDGAAGGWDNYKTNPANKMTQFTRNTNFPNETFSYYWVANVGHGLTQNIKGTVANDYNPVLCSFSPDETANEPDGINLRFGYEPTTNDLVRGIIGGSTTNNFLNIECASGSLIYKEMACTTLLDAARYESNPIDSKFQDKSNWVYEVIVYAKIDDDHEIANVVLKSYYYGIHYLLGLVKDDQGRETSTPVSFPVIKLGTTNGIYGLRVVYDFKTNRLFAAWAPADRVVDGVLDVDADVMFLRHEDEDAAQISFNTNESKIEDIKQAIFAIELENEKTDHGGSGNIERHYFISLPFDCNVKDIFGIGGFMNYWGIQRYNGALRAQIGWFKETSTFWEWLSLNDVMHAGEGYLLSVDKDALERGNVWKDGVIYQTQEKVLDPVTHESIPTADGLADSVVWVTHTDGSLLTLYFPSTTSGFVIKPAEAGALTLNYPDQPCTITREDRDQKDSNWKCIGTPGYKNITSTGYVDKHTGEIESEAPNFIYAFKEQNTGSPWAKGTYEVKDATDFEYQTFHSYMAQFAGDISWNYCSESNVASAPKRLPLEGEKATKAEINLLSADGESLDRTFVRLQENATNGFDQNLDLNKMVERKANQIYSLTDKAVPFAANVLPLETDTVPLVVNIVNEGEYTFSLNVDKHQGMAPVLYDMFKSESINLMTTDYVIELETGKYEDRFFLLFQPEAPIVTNFETTADGGQNVHSSEAIYDVLGRRVNTIYPGHLYIVNGEKRIAK